MLIMQENKTINKEQAVLEKLNVIAYGSLFTDNVTKVMLHRTTCNDDF